MRRAAFQSAIAVAAIIVFAQPVLARGADTLGSTGSGTSVFQANCAVCHGDDGGGSAVGKSLHTPDLRSAKVQQQSNAELARFIGEGKGAMPAFKDRLDHPQILNVVRHIRHLEKHSEAH